MIAERCGTGETDPELRELLVVIAETHGGSVNDADLETGIRFVRGYIEQVPYMMAVALTAAINVGLEPTMEKILEMVQSYWVEGDDIIPDDLGIIGLLDDAYCSLTSLQVVSDIYQLQTGKFLFPDDLSSANHVMRKVIGEPYVTELDRLVIQTTQESGLMQAIKALASPEKQLDIANHSTIWNHGSASSMDIIQLERLGLIDDRETGSE